MTLAEARVVVEAWRMAYDTWRPLKGATYISAPSATVPAHLMGRSRAAPGAAKEGALRGDVLRSAVLPEKCHGCWAADRRSPPIRLAQAAFR